MDTNNGQANVPESTIASQQLQVPAERLRWVCDPAELDFASTAEVAPLEGTVGQDRAVQALNFSLEMQAPGFNLFVAGQPGTGRSTTVVSQLATLAKSKPVPDDWCYVYNFEDADRPLPLHLPAGQAAVLSEDMDQLITTVRRDLRRVFESRQYRQQLEEMHRVVESTRDRLLGELGDKAQKEGFALTMTPNGPVVVPMLNDQPMSEEALSLLTPEAKTALLAKGQELSRALIEIFEQLQQLEKDTHQKMTERQRGVARATIEPLVAQVSAKYSELPDVQAYLVQVRDDLAEHDDAIWHNPAKESQEQIPAVFQQMRMAAEEAMFDRYKVNVLVDNRGLTGAPVIVDQNPTYYNLLGRIEYRAQQGSMVTDFLMIKSGSLHRANGGYLVLNARDVLTSPFAWDALKRTLRTGELKIENIGEQYVVVPAATLRAGPIPLDVKVVLIGPPNIYYLLYFGDEDFSELFRVRADFDTEIKLSHDHLANYAAFISGQVRQLKLRHLDRTAVAKVAEHGARLIERQGKLSANFKDVGDLVTEASYWATKEGSELVSARHVQKAIEQKTQRSNLYEEKIQELIDDGTFMIDTSGVRVGQVNGLSILDVGDYSFGRPVRITSQTAVGTEGVVNLERETQMSGRIHNKGFMILSSFFLARYAQTKPLALSARITFEQTYDEIEGDSASCAELCCLLSALSGLPLRQDVAITGSVNQLGEVQPIGGATRKIEGFFDACSHKGLTGEQGVIIPETNIPNLMLREDVVAAVRDGKFHVWAVRLVDQALEILSGVRAGSLLADGSWEVGTVNAQVDKRLSTYADQLKNFSRRLEPSEAKERAPAEVGPRNPKLPTPT